MGKWPIEISDELSDLFDFISEHEVSCLLDNPRWRARSPFGPSSLTTEELRYAYQVGSSGSPGQGELANILESCSRTCPKLLPAVPDS